MALTLQFKEAPSDTITPSMRTTFVEIEKRIVSNEQDSLHARWECGKELLLFRKGKHMPVGLLDAIAKEVGNSRRELQKRMQFAEKYPTEIQLCNALHNLKSWYQVATMLRTKTENKSVCGVAYSLYIRLPDLSAAHCEFKERIHAPNIRSAINRVLAEILNSPHVKGKHIRSIKISIQQMTGITK